MAISASIVFEVRTTGSDTNGGGFKTGASGTDWTLQDAAQYSVTDGVTAGTTTITSATANFGTDVVGNLIYVQGGTGSVTAGWYEITARTNSTTITVDRSTGLTAGTGVTLKIGGALASPGQAAGIVVSGNIVWQKSGTYTITTSSSNVSAGIINLGSITITWKGYNSSRGDNGTSPVIKLQAGVNSVTIFGGQFAAGSVIQNIEVDGSSNTSIIGYKQTGNNGTVYLNLTARSCTTGYDGSVGVHKYVMCRSVSCTTGFSMTNSVHCLDRCYASGGTTGFVLSSSRAIFCIATGTSGNGFTTSGSGPTAEIRNCVAYNCGGDGFNISTDSESLIIENSIAFLNTGYGFNLGGTAYQNQQMINCAGGSNTSGNYNSSWNTTWIASFVTLSASPFTNAGSGDFSLNNTASAGAACRAAGVPGAFPGGLTTGYLDIGAAQSQGGGIASPVARII